MRFRLLFFVFVTLSIPVAGSAAGQTADPPPQRGDGGLHVSGGGVVGYVGGSGSISGNVVGPGGAQNRATKPAASNREPNAVLGGDVAPAQKATRPVDTDAEEASSTGSNLFVPIALLMAVALLAIVMRRPLRAKFSR